MAADTRSAILALTVDRGGASVVDITEALGLADATVRRHLDRLVTAGLVTPSATVHGGIGRPYQLYQATDAGVRQQRDHSAGLAARMLDQLKHGAIDLDAVAQGIGRRIAAEHRNDVQGASLKRRVCSTVEALRAEGILDAWSETEGGFVLENHACPYREAAEASDCVCESDRIAIQELVGVAVEQVSSLAHGDDTCEYRVCAPAAGGKRNRA